MKASEHAFKTLASVQCVFFAMLCLIDPMRLAYAHNNVVVVPLGGDEARDPTSPLALVDPSQSDYNLFLIGSVIDNITNLQWQRQDDNVSRNWDEALDYCAGLTLSGRSDWRLPDIVELQSIAGYGQSSPAIDDIAFPDTNSLGYWSSSNNVSSSIFAWIIDFETGAIASGVKGFDALVRCVR